MNKLYVLYDANFHHICGARWMTRAQARIMNRQTKGLIWLLAGAV